MNAHTEEYHLTEPGAPTRLSDESIMNHGGAKRITLTGENGLVARIIDTGPLSEKESQVAAGKVVGLSNAQIAILLHMAIDTVKTHLKNVYQNLEVNSACAAVSTAIAEGLIEVTKDAKKETPLKNGLLCLALFLMFQICPFGPDDGYNVSMGDQVTAIDTNRKGGSKKGRKNNSRVSRIKTREGDTVNA